MSAKWMRMVPIAAVVALILGSGYVQGRWSGRWSGSADLDAAVARLKQVPLTFGEWRGEDVAFSPKVMKQAGVEGGLMRTYFRQRDQAIIRVLLVCGRPGPVSVHTPEVCYKGAGFDQVGTSVRDSEHCGTPDRPGSFWTANFRRTDSPIPEELRIFYAWGTPKGWRAAETPRLEFAREPVLYKLYVIRNATSESVFPENDTCVSFLRSFLPVLDQVLKTGSPSPT